MKKKVDLSKLAKYGFKKSGKTYLFKTDIVNGDFNLTVKVTESGEIHTELIEKALNEPYTLHLAQSAEGNFVGKVRDEYNKILNDIELNCYEIDVFESPITKNLIKYITEKYEVSPEYLWEKFPNNAIFRRSDNSKWFAAILTVKYSKLGFESEEIAEVVNLKVKKENIEEILSKPNIHPAYHMNKKSWITIILDGTMNLKEICQYVDNSYNLV